MRSFWNHVGALSFLVLSVVIVSEEAEDEEEDKEEVGGAISCFSFSFFFFSAGAFSSATESLALLFVPVMSFLAMILDDV